ncbi:MAG: PrsW family glutamic-type intramembrane protease [Candidatus Paceibacterota bacterium]|jgi:RsiW-degrading membrane proteinase PrsW (M82 family)
MELTPIFLTLLGALLPAFLWLFFFLKEDAHPEPRTRLIKTFLFGALMSVPALGLQLFFENSFGGRVASFMILTFLFSAIEESAKFVGAYGAARHSIDFDEPMDAMIYMLVAGLGFATVENLFIIGSTMYPLQLGGVFIMGETLIFRFIGATLLHALSSALVGYYWARGITIGEEKYFVVIGILVATAAHGIFNSLVYGFQTVNLLIPSLFLVGVSFFVFKDFEKIKK